LYSSIFIEILFLFFGKFVYFIIRQATAHNSNTVRDDDDEYKQAFPSLGDAKSSSYTLETKGSRQI